MTKCGFCSMVGHNVRTCSSSFIPEIVLRFQSMNSQENLDRWIFNAHTGALSIIMIFCCHAQSTSMPRWAKITYIRDQWRLAHSNQAVPLVHNDVASCHIIAYNLHQTICVDRYNVVTMTPQTMDDDIADIVGPMTQELAVNIVRLTRNNSGSSFRVAVLLIKLLRLEGELKIVIKDFMITRIVSEHTRLDTIGRADASLQQLVPHKPPFVRIQFNSIVAAKSDDYACGICAEDYSQTTIPTLGCKHTLCADCIIGQVKARSKSCVQCPFCREEIKQISVENTAVRYKIAAFVTAEINKS